MRSKWAIPLLLAFVLVACQPAATPVETTEPPPPPPSATPTLTLTPTNTPTPSPTATPTPQLPVSLGMPLPDVREPIRVDNVTQLQMLANYERYDLGKILIKLTPDGKYYFVVSNGGVVSSGGIDVYDAQSRQIIQHYTISQRLVFNRNAYTPDDLQFAADSGRFMVLTSDAEVAIYSLDGEEIYSYTFPEESYGWGGGAGFSPDGKYLAIDICSACGNYPGTPSFKVIDIDSGDVVYENGRSPGGEARGGDPLFSPDGKVMATKMGAQVTLWNTEDWKRITDFGVGTWSNGMVFSPDSTIIATLGGNTVTIWRWEDRQQLRVFNVCEDQLNFPVPQAIFSPNNAYLAVLNCQNIDVWKIADGSQVSEQGTGFANITGMSLGTDGKLTIYEPKAKPGVAYAPWNTWYANGGFKFSGDQTSLQLDFVSPYPVGNACSIPFGGNPNCVEGIMVREGREPPTEEAAFIMGSDGQIYRAYSDNLKKTFELRPGMDASGTSILSFDWNGYMIDAVSLDTTHQLFFYEIWSDPNNSTVYVMDMTTGNNIKQWPGLSIRDQVSYSPDGNLAAFYIQKNMRFQGNLIIYDLENRKQIFRSASSYDQGGVTFSPDGKFLAFSMWAGSEHWQVDFYDVMDLGNPATSIRYQYPRIPLARPSTTRYSPDGSLLSIGFSDGTLRLFDTRVGSMIHEWKAHAEEMTALAFTQDMKYLASASSDGTIRIWGIWP